MIEVVVDTSQIDANRLAFHSQRTSFPGGHRYRLLCVDPEIASVCRPRFFSEELPLTVGKASHLFNLLRMYIVLHKEDGTPPLYWANTVEKLRITDNSVEIEGECSNHALDSSLLK